MNFSRSTRFSGRKSAGPTEAPVMIQRVRVRLRREGDAAGYSHLQQIEAIRRAISNSTWPIARTQAKKPRPKVSFGPAISVGYASDAEYCDVELAARLDVSTAVEELGKHLPPGFSVVSVKSIPRFFPSLEESVNVAAFRLVSPRLAGTEARWRDFEATTNFPITKKKQDGDVVIDARPLVRSWALNGETLELVLRFGPGRTLKPERITQCVCGWGEPEGPVENPFPDLSIRRLQLYFEKTNGDLVEP